MIFLHDAVGNGAIVSTYTLSTAPPGAAGVALRAAGAGTHGVDGDMWDTQGAVSPEPGPGAV